MGTGRPSEEVSFWKRSDYELFKAYREKNMDLLRKPGHYFGAWDDEGKVYMDVSRRVEDKATAMRLGRKNKQKSIYDIKKGEVIWL